MPKKTKREKIIAEYHRKLSGLHLPITPNQDNSPKDLHPQETVKSYAYTYRATAQPSGSFVESNQPYDSSIRRDLIKTLILAVVAISGEIVLSLIMK